MTVTIGNGQGSSGGTVTSNTYETVDDGGTVTDTTVAAGGFLTVSSGGTAGGTTVNGGNLVVSAGGGVSSTTLDDGFVTAAGGIVTGTTVTGGFLTASSGGTVGATTVSGGFLTVGAGGMAAGVTVQGGSLQVKSGGTATGVTMPVSGPGLAVASGGLLSVISLDGDLAAQDGASVIGTVTFGGSDGEIEIGDGTPFGAVIARLAGADRVVLDNLPYSAADTLTISGDVVTVGAPGGPSDVLTVTGALGDGLTLGRALPSSMTRRPRSWPWRSPAAQPPRRAAGPGRAPRPPPPSAEPEPPP